MIGSLGGLAVGASALGEAPIPYAIPWGKPTIMPLIPDGWDVLQAADQQTLPLPPDTYFFEV